MMRRRVPREKPGQGLVEFALILMVVLIIAFGVMDLARVFNVIVAVESSAREGARFLTRNPNNRNGARNAAVNEAQNAGLVISASQVGVTCIDANNNGWCDGGQPAIVTVSHTFTTVMGRLFAASPLTITRRAEMMVP